MNYLLLWSQWSENTPLSLVLAGRERRVALGLLLCQKWQIPVLRDLRVLETPSLMLWHAKNRGVSPGLLLLRAGAAMLSRAGAE